MDSEPSSTVRRLSVEEVAPRLRTKFPAGPNFERMTTPQAATDEIKMRAQSLSPISTGAETAPAYSTLDVAVAAFAGLGYALSARSLLLFALIGAFGLALIAMHDQTMQTLVVLFVYCVFTIPPMVYLEVRKQPRRE